MKVIELIPINGRKSFNKKCRIIEENGVSQLESYNTIVAEYNHRTNDMKIFGFYSNTTLSHINSFLNYYGFDTCTKQELIKNYNL